MGNPASKVGVEIKEEAPDKGSVPSTPILTPKNRTLEDLDPRSPSTNIIRTPIQTILTPIPKSELDDSISEGNKCDTFNINSPAPKVSSIDPRSPTVDFTRTPIILPGESTKIPLKIHNKNFDNVRKTLLSVTPKKLSDVVSRVPPKLLESMPINPKVENKRKSFVGVLETNLDYVETDLDEIIRKKTLSQPELRFSTPNKTRIGKEEEIAADFAGIEETAIAEPIDEVEVNEVDLLKNGKSETKSLKSSSIDVLSYENADPRSPTLEFERTPIQVTKKIGEIDLNENLPTDNENIIVDDDGLINKSTKSTTPPKIIDITPKITQKKANKVNTINDFEKKVSTLIYADEEAAMVSKSITNFKSNNRTPLGVKNGQPTKKNVPKLKVSDKPTRRSEYAVSKIPVFKEKKSSKEAENIPPKDLLMPKRAQWDSNNTLIL